MLSLVEISRLTDPEARLEHELAHLDELMRIARTRRRKVRNTSYIDPDGHTVTKAMDLAAKLIAEAAERRGTDVVTDRSRAMQAKVDELRAVLRAYDDLPLEQWLELRARHTR
jgi:hypothetical protein